MYNPKIYIKSPDFKPPLTTENIENTINDIEKKINVIFRNKIIKKQTNITRKQWRTIQKLHNNEDFIVLPSDKNLGPCITERKTYIERCLHDHLLDKNTYRKLSEAEAEFRVRTTITKCNKIIKKARFLGQTEDSELTFLIRGLNINQRIARFYCMPKIHKNPWKLRPVTSTCGSPLAVISTFLDYKLQPLLKYVPTHIKDSFDLKEKLEKLGKLPKNAKLFTADAISMYTNIDTNHGLEIIEKWLVTLKKENKLCQNFPTTFILELLTLVMKENIFQFGNTYWIQLTGTAMGTPIAVTYANLYSGWKERSELIPKFNKNILHLSRFVDDLFGIWIPDDSGNIKDDLCKYEEFKIELNNFRPGKLKWQIENKTQQVNFLDLNISIQENGILKFKTYQKESNPFLYLPVHSAHPPGTLKALIFGAFRRYWKQNSSTEDFSTAIQKLYQNIKRRAYNNEQLQREFRNATKNIDKK